jgi:hypothetical protein
MGGKAMHRSGIELRQRQFLFPGDGHFLDRLHHHDRGLGVDENLQPINWTCVRPFERIHIHLT